MKAKKSDGESILLAEITKGKQKILFEKNLNTPHYSASLAKVFLAAEFLRLLHSGGVKNREILIKRRDLAGYGTDVLVDLATSKNQIMMDAITLMGLMIKYSCNSSAAILSKYFLPERRILQKNAFDIWGLKNVTLVKKNNEVASDFSLSDFLTLFREIYSKKGSNWDFLREKLKTSRNIYYLFDQLELDILGTKSGTKKIGEIYWINDCGLFKVDRKIYFMGAMVSSNKISKAVLRIREIGKELISKSQ